MVFSNYRNYKRPFAMRRGKVAKIDEKHTHFCLCERDAAITPKRGILAAPTQNRPDFGVFSTINHNI